MMNARQTLQAAAISTTALVCAATTQAQLRIELTSPAAIVNGEIITKAQVEAVVRHQSGHEGQPNPTTMGADEVRSRRNMAVAVLIDDALWRQAIAKQVPAPAQGDVTKRMVALEDDLKKQGRTMQQFCEDTAQTLTQVQNAQSFFLQWTSIVQARATDEALLAYYQQFKDYYEGTVVDVSHIAVRLNANASEADHRKAVSKLDTARKKISEGMTFEDAAAKYSECDTKEKGGHIGPIPRKWGFFDEAFTRAAFDPSLKPGDISGPVTTEYGVELIRLNARLNNVPPGTPTAFEAVKERVRCDFAEDLRQRVIGDCRKQSKITVNQNVVEAAP
jgi:peptidyl-prolyl cis-trans isomerase C